MSTSTLAKNFRSAIWASIGNSLLGIYHWTDAGVASWYDFAVATMEESISSSMLNKEILIKPISTEEYCLPAKRPLFSVLDKSATWIALNNMSRHWRKELWYILDAF